MSQSFFSVLEDEGAGGDAKKRSKKPKKKEPAPDAVQQPAAPVEAPPTALADDAGSPNGWVPSGRSGKQRGAPAVPPVATSHAAERLTVSQGRVLFEQAASAAAGEARLRLWHDWIKQARKRRAVLPEAPPARADLSGRT